MTAEELKALPKVELHCHLDGSLSHTFIEKRLGRKVSQSELSVSDDCRSLNEYLQKFDLPGKCIMNEAGLQEAGYDVLRSMKQENVCYAEIRFAPLLSETQDMNCNKVIEALLNGLERGKKDFGIEYGVITCAMRHHSEEENVRMIRTARAYLGYGVCAADLAGAESLYPMSEFMELFKKTKALGMPMRKRTEYSRFSRSRSRKNRTRNCHERACRYTERIAEKRHRYRDVSDQQSADKSGRKHKGLSDAGVPECRVKGNGKYR